MSGILDPKQRIFDTFITQEGRRQLASGKMKAEFFSFTDGFAIYNTDTIVSGSSLDETNRICFEASSLPQDQVTFEADDSGKLMSFRGSSVNIQAGQIFSGSQNIFVEGSAFASLAGNLINSASIDAFTKLRILGSPDFFDQRYSDFLIGNDNFSFTITNEKPISSKNIQKITIDQMESLFMDKRLSHVPNFKYLPPVNKAKIGATTSSLGIYPSLGQAPITTIEELETEIADYTKNGFAETVTFYQTSKENNLFCQIFEVSNDSLVKLDVIDFGLFTIRENSGFSTKHVFFAGKVFIDSFGSSTFVNMFTIIFEG